MKDTGPSQKEINQRLLEEEEKSMCKKPKEKKNGWGNKKS